MIDRNVNTIPQPESAKPIFHPGHEQTAQGTCSVKGAGTLSRGNFSSLGQLRGGAGQSSRNQILPRRIALIPTHPSNNTSSFTCPVLIKLLAIHSFDVKVQVRLSAEPQNRDNCRRHIVLDKSPTITRSSTSTTHPLPLARPRAHHFLRVLSGFSKA
jgi:hypothetical protein